MKKLLVGFTGLAVAVVSASMFAAFEAHVVNVTATIENALSVPLQSIKFGTVFPQEHLNKSLSIGLSSSFLIEDRVDDVDYIIRQKPKCAITSNNGQTIDEANTATGHVGLGPDDTVVIDCGNPPRPLAAGESWGVLPSLCEYISKEPDVLPAPGNDGSSASFHEPYTFAGRQLVWNDTKGHLAKSQNDTVDNWTIDLAVPCFGGHCAQDWASFVHGINPSADPSQYTQPIANEHKVFGCDLWVEVGGISLPGLGCKGKIDLMLVVDRSGSIGATDMATVRTALNTFVDALLLGPDASHAGQSSFATVGTLDQELTSSSTLLHNAINALVSDGRTNLKEGIDLAKTELESIRDRGDAPDFMVIVTDGDPNEPADAEVVAKASADAAKAAGIEIYVVGVGNSVNETYLKTIASGDDHYFSAANFDDVQEALVDIVTCEENGGNGNPQTGTLTVNKVVTNDSGTGTSTIANFPLFVNGNSVVSGAANTLAPGSYTVTETSNPDYTATFSGDCNVSGVVSIAAGESKSCTITNNDKARSTLLGDGFGTGSSTNDIANWDEEGDDADSTTLALAPTATGNDSVSPDGGRFAKIANGEWICSQVSAAGFHNLALNYYWRGDTDAEGSDDGFAEYQIGSSCDSGVFSTIASVNLNQNTGSWSSLQATGLPSGLNGTSFALRFRNGSNQAAEFFRVDGVAVSGIAD